MKENNQNNLNPELEDEAFEIEELSEEMLEAYLNVTDEQIPDLWDRIETGYEKEIEQLGIKTESDNVIDIKSRAKTLRRKYFSLAAAALFIIVIAIPVSSMMKQNKKSDTKNKADDFAYDTLDGADGVMTEAACDSPDESAGASFNDKQSIAKNESVEQVESAKEECDDEEYDTLCGEDAGKTDDIRSSDDIICEKLILTGAFYSADFSLENGDNNGYFFAIDSVLEGDADKLNMELVIYISADEMSELNQNESIDIDKGTIYEITAENICYTIINDEKVITAKLSDAKKYVK